MSDTKKFMDALAVAADKLADKMFIHGTETAALFYGSDGIFVKGEDVDGSPKSIYLFGDETTEYTVPNYFKRALGEATD